MSLNIYESANPSSYYSVDGTFAHPFSESLNGRTGDTIQKRLYVRNNDDTLWYSAVTVQPIDGGDDLVNSSTGYNWKLYAGDTQPLDAQWAGVVAGTSISLSNIGSASAGDISTYLPFWVRIQIPRGASVASYQSVVLRISATENLV